MKNKSLSRTEQELENKWHSIKKTFLQEYSCLRHDDLNYSAGEFDKMLRHIGEKTGLTVSKLRRVIMRWDDAWLHFF